MIAPLAPNCLAAATPGHGVQDVLRLGRIRGPQQLLVHQEQRVDVLAQRTGRGQDTRRTGRVREHGRAVPRSGSVGAEPERIRLVGEPRVVGGYLDEVGAGAEGPCLDLLVVDSTVRRDCHGHVVGRIETEAGRERLWHVLDRVGLDRIIERIHVVQDVVDVTDRRRRLVAQRRGPPAVQDEVIVGRKVAQEKICPGSRAWRRPR